MGMMRLQPQALVRPIPGLSNRAIGVLPGVSPADVIGGRGSLSLFNNPPRVPDAHGLARSFNGTSSYGTIPLPSFVDPSQPFVIVLAFTPQAVANISRIIHFATATRSVQFTLQMNAAGTVPGSLNFLCGAANGGDAGKVASTNVLTNGQPYVAVVKFDGSAYSMWLNGVPQSGAVTTGINNDFTSVSAIQIGRRSDAASYFQGDISLFAYVQGNFDAARLATNPWMLFDDPLDDEEYVAPAAASGSSRSVAPAGGFVVSGAALATRGRTAAGAGGLALSGAPAKTRGIVRSPAGGVLFAGAAGQGRGAARTASGGLAVSGAANILRGLARTASGGLLFAGAAPVSFHAAVQSLIINPVGGLLLRGSAAVTRATSRIASGGLRLGGAAFVQYHRFGVVAKGLVHMLRRRRRR